VDVAFEVEVALLHRQDLRSPPAGGPPFRAEHGAEGRLPDCDDRLRAEPVEGLAEADRRESLPFSIAGRRRARHQHELALATLPRPVDRATAAIRDVTAVAEQVGPIASEPPSDVD